MLEIKYSLVIEATDDPSFFGFYSPDLEGFTGVGHSMYTTSMDLLKLHGSLNWRVRRGHLAPYTIDAIVHHESWLGVVGNETKSRPEAIEDHLQSEPFMVPPTLAKTLLSEQPILRLVWNKAFVALQSAQLVVFVGYSFPATDFAADVLFTEALDSLPRDNIKIINYARSDAEKDEVRRAYRSRLGTIESNRFDFRGALEWSREVSSSKA